MNQSICFISVEMWFNNNEKKVNFTSFKRDMRNWDISVRWSTAKYFNCWDRGWICYLKLI